MWSTGEGNGEPLQYSCLENPMNSKGCLRDTYKRKHIKQLRITTSMWFLHISRNCRCTGCSPATGCLCQWEEFYRNQKLENQSQYCYRIAMWPSVSLTISGSLAPRGKERFKWFYQSCQLQQWMSLWSLSGHIGPWKSSSFPLLINLVVCSARWKNIINIQARNCLGCDAV